MLKKDISEFCRIYRDGLLWDTLPFWFPRSIDNEHGGFFTALDRDGSVIDTDKSIWQQGRISWLLATLYNTVDNARNGLNGPVTALSFCESMVLTRTDACSSR